MSDFWSVTLPGYTTGFATVALVGVTAWTIRADRRRDRADALRDARKVFAYAEAPGEGEKSVQRLIIVNAGADPIFDVGAGGSYADDTPNPSVFWMPGVHQSSLPYVMPGGQGRLAGQWLEGVPADGPLAPPAEMPYWAWAQLPVEVTWTDGRGIRWHRQRNGEPETRSRG